MLGAAAVALLLPSHSSHTAISAPSQEQLAPGSAGMKAYLDPETGELTVGVAPAGDIDLDADTQNALRRDDEGLSVVRSADGTLSMDLQGRFQNVSVARIDENGKVTICTENVSTVENVITDTKVNPNVPEVK